MPAAMSVKGNSDEIGNLILPVMLGLLLGLWLARSRISTRGATLVGALLGMVLVVLAVGRILPPFTLLWREVGYALEWSRDWLGGDIAWPAPFSTALAVAWQRAGAFGNRLWWWGQAVTGNAPNQDRIVVQLLIAYLVWAASLFAAWQVYRRRSALFGLAPAGIIVTVVAFFRGEMAFFYLAVYLFCTLWLVAISRLWRQTERWDQQGIDYPGGLGLELTLSLGPWLLVIVILAAFFPVLYPHRLHQAFWEAAEEPWERVVDGAERFAGPIDDGYPGGPGYQPGEGGELPSAHLLTGGPDLSEKPVLYVSSSDPAPPREEPDQAGTPKPVYPRRYWRSRTYDTYTGRGWVNSPLESQALSPNETLPAIVPASEAGTILYQQFERLVPGEVWLYAANAPHMSDSPVQAWQRAPGDPALFTAEADIYTVLSRAPEPTALELRSSSPITGTLPAEITGRYLALPDAVPERVLDLARQVAGDGPTRYDRARAIERYLRGYPYTLELPEPPDGRDLVDYFLFERQEGYCDYYASAMVVMARAMGIPARLASGYAQGTYDHDARRWVVAERDGHSWVEVYFEGIGWVEFEPTAGLPALDRPGGLEAADLPLPPLPVPTLPWWQGIPWGLIAVGGVALLLGVLIVWIWRPRPALSATQLVQDRQARLLRWGARLGRPLRDGQTAQEYAHSLAKALRDRGRRARWSAARRSGEQAPPAVEALTDAFVRAQYSPRPISDREGWRIRDGWARLRRHFWNLWFARGVGRDGGGSEDTPGPLSEDDQHS
jgi:transglutaminase-like putative cysteine protease